jgi:hypothetical protein
MTAKQVSGQVSPDRLSTLEAETAQLKVTLAEARGDVLHLEGTVRELGRSLTQGLHTYRELTVVVGRMADHIARHDNDSPLCSFCVPKEGLT